MMTLKTFVDFAGNDYLGLARDRRLAEAAYQAALDFGVSPTSSRWGLGWTEIHEQLETELASFLSSEAVCLLGQAFLGGAVYFSALADDFDAVYCDELSHTNLRMGMRAAGMRTETYRHLNAEDLRKKLAAHTGRPPIIATDTVFGISGELAPLPAIRDIAQRHGAELLLDDAHGVFALGSKGQGAAELCGLARGEATVLGTMSKSLGAGGGFLAGRRELIERCRRSAPASACTPLSIPIAAAADAALRIVREEPARLRRLKDIVVRMREIIGKNAIQLVADQTHILAMQLADASSAERMSAHFLSHNIRIPYFKYPADPRDHLLRAVARSCYSDDELAAFAHAAATFSG